MGLMRFLIPERERLRPEAVGRAYIAGLDGVPTVADKTWESGSLLRLQREIDESGNLFIPWDADEQGPLVLSTTSLMERQQPYHLPLELARGTLNRLRTKASVWQLAGLELPEPLADQIRAATQVFIRAATGQQDPLLTAALADETLRLSLEAIGELSREYAAQVLRFRHTESSPLATLIAGNLGDAPLPPNTEPMFGAAFNSAVIPIQWQTVQAPDAALQWTIPDRQLQLCLRQRLKIIAGPLLRLDAGCLPTAAVACYGDFARLTVLVQQYLGSVVQRYRGQVHLWHCAAAANLPSGLPLSDEQRLRLTVTAIETTRRADPRTPVIVSFDQPFAEYLSDQTSALPPMHFAEMLVRAELGLAGIGLELNLGYWPGGTLLRDLLEIGQLIDQWSTLGLPLIPLMTIPSSNQADPLASLNARPFQLDADDAPSFQSQKQWIERLLPMLVAKQSVQGVVWNQLFDSLPHRFPHGGLFDAVSRPKPSLSSIIAVRRDHLT